MIRMDVRLTDAGRREREDELLRCEAMRPEIANWIAATRAEGSDPAENLDLRDAMDSLTQLEARIGELRTLLAVAETLTVEPSRDGTARLGTTVRLRHADGEEASYVLVTPAEAAPRRGRISVESPIGRAVLGRKKGDDVLANTPGGTEEIFLLDVA